MTYADINKMFTAEVSKYLARGYHFNTASMSGSQGETAKVDLTNGTEIIRVLLRTFSDGWDKQGTELFVGRVAEKENVRRDVAYCVNTIWNNRLEPVSSQPFDDFLYARVSGTKEACYEFRLGGSTWQGEYTEVIYTM